MTKYIFVTGGVVSGLGKGITAASLGRLLKARGLKVAAQKLDPYMNIDPGTMSTFQHGEAFVTEDGAETDLDLGHYERFIDETTPYPVIDFMPDQNGVIPKGGTMRLGSYPCAIAEGSQMAKAYGSPLIHERHRHRYEFNNALHGRLVSAGLRVSGTSPDGRIVETVEVPGLRFFIGVQFHPEFKSRPNHAHPLFRAFMGSAL